MRLRLLHDQLEALEQEARSALPEECCGLLVGQKVEGGWHVLRLVPSPNVSRGDRRRSFEVDPSLRIRLERELRGSGLGIIGHYHSHPDAEARPSPSDQAAAFEPELLWLIIGMDGEGQAAFGAFKPHRDRKYFEPVEIVSA